jgi:hypothetical protein
MEDEVRQEFPVLQKMQEEQEESEDRRITAG